MPLRVRHRMAQGTFGCVIMGGTIQLIGGWALTRSSNCLTPELSKPPLIGAYHQGEIAMERNDGFGFR